MRRDTSRISVRRPRATHCAVKCSEWATRAAPNCDDDERDVAYDRDFKLSPLVEALDQRHSYGITLVSMKRDWKTVFGPEIA